MKSHLVLLFLLVVPATLAIFSPSIDEILHDYEDGCSKESGLDSAEIDLIRKNRRVEDNIKANQWAKCMMQKHNVIKIDGTINQDVGSINIPADTDTVIRAFPTCKNKTGRAIADTARLMMNCYLRESEGLIMAIYSQRFKITYTKEELDAMKSASFL